MILMALILIMMIIIMARCGIAGGGICGAEDGYRWNQNHSGNE